MKLSRILVVIIILLTCSNKVTAGHISEELEHRGTHEKSTDYRESGSNIMSPASIFIDSPTGHRNSTKHLTTESKHIFREKKFTRGQLPKYVALCAVVRDEELYIDEWINYHLYLGFDSVYIFDNSLNGSAKIAYLPQHYDNTVRVFHAPGDGVQNKIYNLFVQQIGLKASPPMWAAFLDVDEFIVLRKHRNIKAFIADVMPKAGGSVSMNRVQFGANGQLTYEPGPILSRFTMRRERPANLVRSIAYLPDVQTVDTHHCSLRNGVHAVNAHGERMKHPRWLNPNGTTEVAYINHYYTKSVEEFRAKRLRGSALSVESNATPRDPSTGEALILSEFIKADAGANAVQDTFAWDFYRSKRELNEG